MREKVHLCGESKKKARGDAAAQRGDTEVAFAHSRIWTGKTY